MTIIERAYTAKVTGTSQLVIEPAAYACLTRITATESHRQAPVT